MEEHRPKKLVDQLHDAARLRHYSNRTKQACIGWIKCHIYFHGARHPSEMGAREAEAFLSLGDQGNVAIATCVSSLAQNRERQPHREHHPPYRFVPCVPHDEKILTSWNGLMLAAFAEAARVLGREDGSRALGANYREVAEQALSIQAWTSWSPTPRKSVETGLPWSWTASTWAGQAGGVLRRSAASSAGRGCSR
jgi:hypothetical protein